MRRALALTIAALLAPASLAALAPAAVATEATCTPVDVSPQAYAEWCERRSDDGSLERVDRWFLVHAPVPRTPYGGLGGGDVLLRGYAWSLDGCDTRNRCGEENGAWTWSESRTGVQPLDGFWLQASTWRPDAMQGCGARAATSATAAAWIALPCHATPPALP